MDEREAVRRLRQGEIDALEPLVRAHQPRALRAAYLITRDRAQAEDIVQTAFVRAFERIGQLESDGSFGPWLLRIVVNDATKVVVRAQRQDSLDGDDRGVASIQTLEDPGIGPAEALEHVETRDELWAALGCLPASQRAAIVLRYYLDLSEAEMAARLSTPAGTVKWRLHAARRRLRQILRERETPDAPAPAEE